MNINGTSEPTDKKNYKENKPNASNAAGITVKNPGSFNKPNKKRNKKRNNFNKGAENKNPVQQADKQEKETQELKKDAKPFKTFNHNKPAKPFKQFKPKKTEEIFNENIPPETEYQSEDINVTTDDNLNFEVPENIETGPKTEIVGVRFKPVGKIYFFSPDGIIFSANDKIIVETSRGLELGYIVIPNKNIRADKVVQPLKPVLKKATEEDAERAEKNKKMAKETIKIANDRIKFHNLNNMKMKLIEAEYTFDNSKLIYYFTADGRVDFRELVKDLAAIFKTRIEMRQIGIRDQTKILGGLSICGRPFCCNSFLQDFAQVTIKMAKEQNLSINSSKISGACGRLMCCLKYEHDAYDYLSKDTPKVNSVVETSTGETGVVVESNLLTGICKVKLNQRTNAENHDAIQPFPKKNLKVIGFMKNEHEHLYNKEDNNAEEI